MIPKAFMDAIDGCAQKMTEACGHYVTTAVDNVEMTTCNSGIGTQKITTISVFFSYCEIIKPRKGEGK